MESVERTKNETRRDLDATRGGDVNAGVGASGVGSLGGGVRSGTRSIHGIGGAVGGAVGVDVGGDRVGGGDAGAGVGVDFVGGGHVVGDTYDSIVICRDLEKRFPGAEGEHGLRRSFFDDWAMNGGKRSPTSWGWNRPRKSARCRVTREGFVTSVTGTLGDGEHPLNIHMTGGTVRLSFVQQQDD